MRKCKGATVTFGWGMASSAVEIRNARRVRKLVGLLKKRCLIPTSIAISACLLMSIHVFRNTNKHSLFVLGVALWAKLSNTRFHQLNDRSTDAGAVGPRLLGLSRPRNTG